PDPTDVRVTKWSRVVEGELEELDDYIENWDQQTEIELRCVVEADVEAVRTKTRIRETAKIGWSGGWRTNDTKLVGYPVLLPLTSQRQELRLAVPPQLAGAAIVLTRRRVLLEDRPAADNFEAHIAGSVLWSDERIVRLTGSGAAFPTEIVDFAGLRR